MTTTNDIRRETRGPVTPPGRTICINSPPGAPRRVRVRRPPRRPRSRSVHFSTSPWIGPEAFQRLLLASVGVRSGTGGVGMGGSVAAANTAASAQAQDAASPTRIRPVVPVAPYWVNTGFVVGFDPFDDEPFGPVIGCPPSTAAAQGNNLNAGEDIVDVEMTDANGPVVDLLGRHVAVAIVVAAVSSVGDAVSTDPMEI